MALVVTLETENKQRCDCILRYVALKQMQCINLLFMGSVSLVFDQITHTYTGHYYAVLFCT